ncbi:TPA: flagellar motor switch protein FliG [Candidatus Poribacteria bacterium]|nr:flagellar motor switch protein FliG [Candidatus Poribacteria bacterium]
MQQTTRFEDLTGRQKAAVLLIALGINESSGVMEQFNAEEIEIITTEIGQTRMLSGELRLEVLREFRMLLMTNQYMVQGGLEYARSILKMVMREDEADRMLERVSRSVEGNPFDFMEQADPESLVAIIQTESPQTIALILANLSPDQASSVLSNLDPDMKLDVVKRISALDEINPEVLTRIQKQLRGKISAIVSTSKSDITGPQRVAQIMQNVDSVSQTAILSGISAEDPDLSEEISSAMFTFEDLMFADKKGFGALIRSANDLDIATSLKLCSEELTERIFASMSQRKREEIEEEVKIMDPKPVAIVLEAHERILDTAKAMIDEEELMLVRDVSQVL